MYDLLIKGGRVIDPAQNIDAKRDIAINGDKIAAIALDIPAKECKQVVDARSKIVTPGLIDLHCHVYDAVHDISTEPDNTGVKQGVTTVVDAGSAGQAIFPGFLKYIIPSNRTTVYCFLHLGSPGLILVPELKHWGEINLKATAATIESNSNIIKGVKLRLVGNSIITDAGVEVVKTAKRLARKFNLPIMIHIGDLEEQVPLTLTQEILPLMEAGDILSHVFTAKRGGVLRPDGTVLPELREAMKRGVVLDIAHGRYNLSYEVARNCMAQGIFPTTISSDVVAQSLAGPAYGMTVTMSKFLALGLDLKRVIEMSTITPARVINIENKKGSLKPGMDADVSILELISGIWQLRDAERQTIEATRLIAPSMTIKAGSLIPAQPVAQPQPVIS